MAIAARARAQGAAGGARRPAITSSRGRAGLGHRQISSADRAGGRRLQIAEIQRLRLLAAAAHVVDELGYGQTTVANITTRARVSRRTFYELFADREECLVAVIEDAVVRLRAELAPADLVSLGWRERIRTGLWTILCFLDREPVLARVCVVQSLRGGPTMLARREQLLAELAVAVDGGRAEGARAGALPSLTAEGLVSAAVGIVYNRLLRGGDEPLRSLHRELVALIVLPYLGVAAARREQRRPLPANTARNGASGDGDPLGGVAMRITYRTARVLQCVAEQPGSSNRALAEHAGIHDQGQISKLLGRLARLGLVSNSSAGHAKGAPNVWRLTPRGEHVARSFHAHDVQERSSSGGETAR